jgi:predicted nucleic acid-binding protein
MSKTAAFWDSSALVPLCINEATSRHAHAQLRKFMPVVWWGSPVEVHSAVARLHRLGKLKNVEKQGALSRLDLLCRGWREILPGDHVRELARGLLDAHELRAADGLQLAGSPNLVPTTSCEKGLRLCRSTIIQSGNNRRLLGA